MRYADVKVIHNGIDLDIFQPSESEGSKRLNCKDGRKTVLAVSATWGERKGYKYVLELARRLPKDEYRVIIVGLNERQLEALPEGIMGISRTANQQELADLYSTADVLVNTTLEDTYPTVNLESIACGTPVVTFRTGGSPESVTSETGSVVEQHDIAALEREVIRWANTDAKEACRNYAIKNFDRNKCFDEYTSLFCETVERRRNG